MIDIAEKIKNTDVTNLMTKRVITITENQTLQEASKLMYQNNVGSVIILKSADEIDSESLPSIFSNNANIRSDEQAIIGNNN
jgi:CBS domain-containing protein